jgi:lauroyl/myristoyl acyltransferase
MSDFRWIIGQVSKMLTSRMIPLNLRLAYANSRGNIRIRSHDAFVNAMHNIRDAFPEMDEDLATQLAQEHFAFRRRLELHSSISRGVRAKRKWWALEGREQLDQSLAHGKGVVLVSAHFGHVRLIVPALQAHGYRTRLVRLIGEEQDQRLQRWKKRYDRATRLQRILLRNFVIDPSELCQISAGLDIRPIISALSSNEVVIILGDGFRSSEFMTGSILGMPYPFPLGYMKIAVLTGASVLPVFATETKPRFGLHIKIYPALPVSSSSTAHNVNLFAKLLDEELRLRPHLWYRWSTRNVFRNALKWAKHPYRWDRSFTKWTKSRIHGNADKNALNPTPS